MVLVQSALHVVLQINNVMHKCMHDTLLLIYLLSPTLIGTPDPSDGDSLISTFYQLPIRPRQYVITIEASSLCEDSTSLERRFRTGMGI